jgi:hypothetical protein
MLAISLCDEDLMLEQAMNVARDESMASLSSESK